MEYPSDNAAIAGTPRTLTKLLRGIDTAGPTRIGKATCAADSGSYCGGNIDCRTTTLRICAGPAAPGRVARAGQSVQLSGRSAASLATSRFG